MHPLVAKAAIPVLTRRVPVVASETRNLQSITHTKRGGGRYSAMHTVTALHHEGQAAGLLLQNLLTRCRCPAGDTQQYAFHVIAMCSLATMITARAAGSLVKKQIHGIKSQACSPSALLLQISDRRRC